MTEAEDREFAGNAAGVLVLLAVTPITLFALGVVAACVWRIVRAGWEIVI